MGGHSGLELENRIAYLIFVAEVEMVMTHENDSNGSRCKCAPGEPWLRFIAVVSFDTTNGHTIEHAVKAGGDSGVPDEEIERLRMQGECACCRWPLFSYRHFLIILSEGVVMRIGGGVCNFCGMHVYVLIHRWYMCVDLY